MRNLKITPAFVVDRPAKFKPEDIESNVIIHFRPASDWLGKGYGFDWMREVDYNLVSPSNAKGDAEKYEDTVSKHYREPLKLTNKLEEDKTDDEKKLDESRIAYDASNPYKTEIEGKPYLLEEGVNNYEGTFVKNLERFRELKRVYNYHNIIHPSGTRFDMKDLKPITIFPEYYCSWMSIYPDPNKQVKLSLIAEALDDKYPDSYELEYNEEFFDISLDKEADLKKLTKGAKKGIPDAITFTCKKEFDKDQIISIYSVKEEKKRLAGRMYVWSNEQAKQKKANIISVIVNTKMLVPELGSPPSPSSPSPVESIKELNADYLRQALIELKDGEVITLDLSNDKNFQPVDTDGNGGHYYHTNGIVGYYTSSATWSSEKSEWIYDGQPNGYSRLGKYLYEKIKEQLRENGLDENKYENYTRVYYLDKKLYNTDGHSYQSLGGYSEVGNRAVVLKVNVSANTVAHEILHALNIMHSFNNREYQRATKFCFKAKTTDNIMDYSHLYPAYIPMNCLWKHQWEVANKSVMSNGSIKSTQQLEDEHVIMPK